MDTKRLEIPHPHAIEPKLSQQNNARNYMKYLNEVAQYYHDGIIIFESLLDLSQQGSPSVQLSSVLTYTHARILIGAGSTAMNLSLLGLSESPFL